jgi:hypothetical protein
MRKGKSVEGEQGERKRTQEKIEDGVRATTWIAGSRSHFSREYGRW